MLFCGRYSRIASLVCAIVLFTYCSPNAFGFPQGTISGELKRWHKVTIDFEGPQTSETATTNPFTDFRLNVAFVHEGTGRQFDVPGYYAADGDAADSGATGGNVWRVHFAPDDIGNWGYVASFRTGANIAMSSDPNAGTSAGFFDGHAGIVSIGETDKSVPDFRSEGRLEFVNQRYLRFQSSGRYFLKQGPDSPENFLAYDEFDGPFANDGQGDNFIKSWAPHVPDWNPGDPTWGNAQGKGIIGALNYLASEGLNAFSFLTMNINGDDKNVFPYLNYNERLRMDVSRLAQWEIVFEHADHLGLFLHFKTQETENDQLLDGGALGNQRKLYYRELIARFAHHLALNWNLGEENTNTDQQRKDFAQYFFDNDPYHHHIVIHTFPNQQDNVYGPLLGNASKLTGASVQTTFADFSRVHSDIAKWVVNSEATGKPWAVAIDEPGDAQHALRPDNDAGNSHVDGRKNALWGSLLAGGWGCEYYFGYGHAHSDLTLQDFRSRDQWWDVTRYALEFFAQNDIPFWEMQNDNLVSSALDDYCFFQPGECYIAYLKNGGTTSLNLESVSASFDVEWFNPRAGGGLQAGPVVQVGGQGNRPVGQPPSQSGQDWIALVRRIQPDGQNTAPVVTIDRADRVVTSGSGAFLEDNGLLVMEMESQTPVDDWELQTDIAGFTGNGFFRWEGPNLFGNPGAQGVMSYPFRIENPGTYQMRFRNHRDGDVAFDAENDVWAKLDNENWIKVFSGMQGQWNWASNFDFGKGNRPSASYVLSAGDHTFTISGRSNGFRIDRVIFYEPSLTSAGQAQNTSQPQSQQEGAADELTFFLDGHVIDDGEPVVFPSLQWSLQSGPGTATFESPQQATTNVTFSVPGIYVVKLTADDGEFQSFATRVIDSTASTSLAFEPVDDATVEGQNGQNNDVLKVQNSGPTRTSYLKFDVQNLSGNVQQAELRLTVSQDPGSGTIQLFRGDSNSWSESTISASNAPGTVELLDSVAGTHAVGNVLVFDVSTLVTQNGQYTFVVTHAGGNDVWFSSKEGNAPPELEVTTSSQVEQVVTGDEFQVIHGRLASGTITDLAVSDDSDVSVSRSPTDLTSRTRIEVAGTSPVASPSEIRVALESSVFARSVVNQSVELFDFDANDWEEVDLRQASRFSDESIEISIQNSASRFVEPGTNQMWARVGYDSPQNRQRFTSNIDVFFWTVVQ